jgi:hypothetical protein
MIDEIIHKDPISFSSEIWTLHRQQTGSICLTYVRPPTNVKMIIDYGSEHAEHSSKTAPVLADEDMATTLL